MLVSEVSLSGPSADIPLTELSADWFGARVDHPPSYAIIRDPSHLWLLATREAPAVAKPGAHLGDFVEGLWEYDVAECFIAEPDGSRYLELNLSPHGAWWCCAFEGPRNRKSPALAPPDSVRTYAESTKSGGWSSAIAMPLNYLEKHFNFADAARLNVTMILQKPKEQYLTATDIGSGQPDYHRPDQFLVPERSPL